MCLIGLGASTSSSQIVILSREESLLSRVIGQKRRTNPGLKHSIVLKDLRALRWSVVGGRFIWPQLNPVISQPGYILQVLATSGAC